MLRFVHSEDTFPGEEIKVYECGKLLILAFVPVSCYVYEKRATMTTEALTRFGVSIAADLIKKFDHYISRAGYRTRSEAIRDLIRARLVDEGAQDADALATGVLSLVYDHHRRELEDHLTDLQHDHHELIIATTHVHLDHHNCLEVVLLKGTVGKIRDIGAALASFKGVKFSSLNLVTTRELT